MSKRVAVSEKEILAALLDNKNNKNKTAEQLGISRQALHIRLTAMLSNKTATFDKMTDKEKGFITAVAEGEKPTQAVMNAYDVQSKQVASQIASSMMHKPAIQKALKEILEDNDLTRENCAGELSKLVFKGKDEGVRLRALDQTWKLRDDYPAEKKVQVNVNLDFFPVDLSQYKLDNVNFTTFNGAPIPLDNVKVIECESIPVAEVAEENVKQSVKAKELDTVKIVKGKRQGKRVKK